MKNVNIVLAGVLVCALALCGCNKDEVPIEVIMPVDIENTAFEPAEKVAVNYAEYLKAGDYQNAYNIMYIPDDYYINEQEFESVESKISDMPDSYELINVSSSGDIVTLEYGKKIGESYGKKKKGAEAPYLGDKIQGRESFKLEVTQEGIQPNMVVVDDDLLTDETISVKLPGGVSVWLGGKLLDDTTRDNDGYYNISHFVDTDILTLKADCDVEQGKIINLNLKAEIGEEIVDNASLAPTSVHNGNNAWDYVWETDRITNEEAAEWISGGFQTIFNSVIMREDFMRATFRDEVMSEKSNLETIKVGYMKCLDTFAPTKSTLYTDLTCVEFVPYTAEERQKRGVVFEMLDNKTMRLYGVLKYSYIKYNYNTDDTSVRSGEVKGQVTLTKDEGEWKFLSFDEKFLRGVA